MPRVPGTQQAAIPSDGTVPSTADAQGQPNPNPTTAELLQDPALAGVGQGFVCGTPDATTNFNDAVQGRNAPSKPEQTNNGAASADSPAAANAKTTNDMLEKLMRDMAADAEFQKQNQQQLATIQDQLDALLQDRETMRAANSVFGL